MKRRCLWAAMTIVFFVATRAEAQEDPRRAQSEALFKEGLKLHDRDREPEALEKFEKSYAILPTPNTLYWIAREEHLLGKLIEALRHYREALKNPLLEPKATQLAKQYVAELEPRFARVLVKGPTGTTVAVAEQSIRLPFEEPIDVEPGTIVLRGDREGIAYGVTGVAEAGKTTIFELKESSSPGEPRPPIVELPIVELPPPDTTEGRPFWDPGRIAGVAAIGTGALAFGAGVLFGASSNSSAERADALQRQLGPTGCSATPSASCAELNDERDAQDRNATLSTIFVAGGSALAIAGVALAVWPRSHPLQVTPSAGRNGAGLTLSGNF